MFFFGLWLNFGSFLGGEIIKKGTPKSDEKLMHFRGGYRLEGDFTGPGVLRSEQYLICSERVRVFSQRLGDLTCVAQSNTG